MATNDTVGSVEGSATQNKYRIIQDQVVVISTLYSVVVIGTTTVLQSARYPSGYTVKETGVKVSVSIEILTPSCPFLAFDSEHSRECLHARSTFNGRFRSVVSVDGYQNTRPSQKPTICVCVVRAYFSTLAIHLVRLDGLRGRGEGPLDR